MLTGTSPETVRLCAPELCTGCAACANACGTEALSMVPDREGFLRPEIDPARCIRCGRCERACPRLRPVRLPDGPKTTAACWHADEAVRGKSTSGGAFTALAECVLAKGGVVYGAAFDGFPAVRHVRVDSVSGLARFRGSKYVQSETGDAFRSAKNDLDRGVPVLFSGTPCQIAGLHSFLGSRREDLLRTVDLACWGVNSPLVFAEYAKWLEKRNGSRIVGYEFRNKDAGWKKHRTVVDFENGIRAEERPDANPFYVGFSKHLFLRPSCSTCPFANRSHPADVTIADFWGYSGVSDADADDGKGVSALVANTDAGRELFDGAKERLVYFHRHLSDFVSRNAAMKGPSLPDPSRSVFWRDFERLSFCDELVRTHLSPLPPPGATRPRRRTFATALAETVLGRTGANRTYRTYAAARCRIGNGGKAVSKGLRKLRVRVLDRIALFAVAKTRRCAFVFVSPGHRNLGDNAQTLCIRELLEKRFPKRKILFFTNNYIAEAGPGFLPFVKSVSSPEDPAFLHSGYRMTDVWPAEEEMHRRVVATFDDRPVVSFPQTIHYVSEAARAEAARTFNAHPNNTVMCRDAVSFEAAKAMFPTCRLLLVPDVVMSKIGQMRFDGPRSGILVCKRKDRESSFSPREFSKIVAELSRLDEVTVADTNAKDPWKTFHRDLDGYLRNVWRDFARYRLVVTDRFHGTIFSLIASTPVLVVPTTDHKVRSGLDWFPESFSEYVRFVPDPADVPAVAARMLSVRNRRPLPPYFRETFFDRLFDPIPLPKQ